jgi:hypothetical protein
VLYAILMERQELLAQIGVHDMIPLGSVYRVFVESSASVEAYVHVHYAPLHWMPGCLQ